MNSRGGFPVFACSSVAASFLGLSLASLGCSDEKLAPLPTPSATTQGPGGSGAGGGPPKVRDVFVRNPIGLPHQNLLADGDFEMSIVPEGDSGQYGWIAFGAQGGARTILGETGGLCRSGVRCGRVSKNTVLFARGTSAAGNQPHRASIFAKPIGAEPPPADKPCDLMTAYVIECASFDVLEKLAPESAPESDGYCQLSAEVAPSTTALCMYLEVEYDELLLDQATLLPAPDLGDKTRAKLIITGERRARMDLIRERIRSRLLFGDAPLDPAQLKRNAKGD